METQPSSKDSRQFRIRIKQSIGVKVGLTVTGCNAAPMGRASLSKKERVWRVN